MLGLLKHASFSYRQAFRVTPPPASPGITPGLLRERGRAALATAKPVCFGYRQKVIAPASPL
jgi:hypothetical protein